MNRSGASSGGYTIVEIMIFLAISGLMFLSAMFFLSGQQSKNEFATGIREIQSQLNDIINDISTGYYNKPSGFTCTTTSPGSPVIGSGAGEDQGTNPDCTFVGKVLQLASTDNGEDSMELYTMVGRRQSGTPPSNARSLEDASPIILDATDSVINLPYGIKIKKVEYEFPAGTTLNAGSIGFFTRFTKNNGTGGITGSQDIDLIPIMSTTLNQLRGDAKTNINTLLSTSIRNPDSGIKICFDSGGTDQHAEILIGGQGRQNSTTLTISNGPC